MSLATFVACFARVAPRRRAGSCSKRWKRNARRGRRRGLLESLLFARAPLLSILPRRQATLEMLEPREMLTASFTMSTAQGIEGSTLNIVVNFSGVTPGALISYSTSDGTATLYEDYPGSGGGFNAGASSGSFTFSVATLNDEFSQSGEPANNETINITVQDPNDAAGVRGVATILEDGSQPRFCTCNCGCGTVEPSVDPATGAALVGDGAGGAPQALSYNSYQEPHPMVDVLDTLSSTVASATNIETQLTLQNLSGSTVWTGTPVYYTPAGYTQGEQVEFAGQIDATGLADGTYERVMTVTENYANSPPVVRTYSGWVGIENRDNSPYGAGWAPHNIDRLVIQSGNQASGASLVDGSGNVFWFQLNSSGAYVPPDDSPQFVSLVKNQDGTYTLTKNDHSSEQFSSTGLLTKATDRQGNWLTYSYNGDNTIASVQDEVGRTTSFTYSGGYLSSVTDFAGRTTSYVFTGGQLTQITRPAPGNGEAQPVTTLGYDRPAGF